MPTSQENNKRIAKNTVLLYVRTLLIMIISLYTSRVVLATLGVKDYGIYNVVGGVIAMFSVVSGSISNAISRFITFELGKGNTKKLNDIFCTSVNIEFIIAGIVLLLGETIGVWFLNTQMNIPEGRMYAANWVLQFSLLSFIIGLWSVPYNASIIAHEKMSAFAYVSILEASLKLLIVYMLVISPWDKLITYSILLSSVDLLIRIVYGVYCKIHFEECGYHFVWDRGLLKQMGGFSGWQFLTNTTWIINTQGINILLNIYYGVAINTARGVANQVDGAIMRFVTSFTTALNPQITKDYAKGDKDALYNLVCNGAKYTFFLMMLFQLPAILEANTLLHVWLKNVPEHAVTFLQLTMVGTMFNMLGNTQLTACLATGNIKRYTVVITLVGLSVFPLSWIGFALGFPPEWCYIAFIITYIAVLFARLFIMRGLIGCPIMLFVRKVFFKIVPVAILTAIIPIVFVSLVHPSFLRLVATVAICSICSLITIYTVGITSSERNVAIGFVKKKLHIGKND